MALNDSEWWRVADIPRPRAILPFMPDADSIPARHGPVLVALQLDGAAIRLRHDAQQSIPATVSCPTMGTGC
jgi:hypothetical protein